MKNEKQELVREWESENRFKQLAFKVFFTIGERLALIFLLIAAVIVLSIQNSDVAYSEKKPEKIAVEYLNIPTETPARNASQSDAGGPTPIPPTPARNATQSVAGGPTPTSAPTPTDTPTPTPTPTAAPTPTSVPVDPNDNAIWDKIAECESHQNWGINTGNGYFGGLQFNQGAWNAVGGTGLPSEASRDEQITRGKLLQAQRGWGAWGECAVRLGLN